MWKNQIRALFAPLLLITNSIVWFSLSWFVIEGMISNSSVDGVLPISLSYFGTLLISAVVGTTLLNKLLRRRKYLAVWILLGAITCAFSAFLIIGTDFVILIAISVALGALAGLGIPTCLAMFSEATTSKNRGRNGAIAFFLIQLITVLIYVPISSLSADLQLLFLAAWRLFGILGIALLASDEKVIEEQKSHILEIIRERRVYLFFVPWFLFTIVNFVEQPLVEQYFTAEIYNQYMMIGILITSLSAFLGGAICDYKGRKSAGILGFVLLGIGYAFLTILQGTQLAQILWTLLVGIAWGILYVTFIFVIWGDIAEGKSQEKHYFLGGMPFLLSNLISVLVKPFAETTSIETLIETAFPLATFFLFLAILPLLYAPETLPAKIVQDRELKNYIEKAQKTAEKSHNINPEDKEESERETESEENPEDEKARKLAEKYY